MKTIHWFRMSPEGGDGNSGGGGGDSGQGGGAAGGDDAAKAKIQELEAALAAERKAKSDLSSKVSTLSGEIQKIREQGLRSKEDYKTLAETMEKKAQELEGENSKLKQSIFHTSRVSAVKDVAVKAGLRSAALGDIEAMDLEEVKVTVGDDRIIRTEGAEPFVNKLKTLKPYLFETPKDPNFNGGGGAGAGSGGGGEAVTQQQLVAAYQQRNRGTKEMAAYRELQKRFDDQTRKAKAK